MTAPEAPSAAALLPAHEAPLGPDFRAELAGRTVVVVGGGFYGCHLALSLVRDGVRVVLLEREPALMSRASYVNQARVHGGYHYPRSVLTALRSRVNFPRFIAEHRDCVATSFDKYYAIARQGSKVTARQFAAFAQRIDAPLTRAPESIRKLFDASLIEEVFEVEEFAFDATVLRASVLRQLEREDVDVRYGWEASSVDGAASGEVVVRCRGPQGDAEIVAAAVFNCTYSRLNRLLQDSNVGRIPLKHELTELALVEPPHELEHAGVTVMCGPFFSIMPFPARGLHSLSHVRYTPHVEWSDTVSGPYVDPFVQAERFVRRTNYPAMVRDAMRYLPCVWSSRYVESLWEVKTLLPQSEIDDSRPILFRRSRELPGLISVLGSKIDNVYELTD